MEAIDAVRQFVNTVLDLRDEANCVGPMDPLLVGEAELLLQLRFPPSFRMFAEQLGSCEVAGLEFLGVSRSPDGARMLGCVRQTIQLRDDSQLPANFVAFHNDGMGGYFVLDTNQRDAEDESPVYVWQEGGSRPGDQLELVGSSFGECVLRMLAAALRSEA